MGKPRRDSDATRRPVSALGHHHFHGPARHQLNSLLRAIDQQHWLAYLSAQLQ